MLCGGHSSFLAPTPEIVQLAQKHRGDVEAKLGRGFQTYTVLGFTKQVVAGMNYKIQIDVGNGQKANIKVYEPLSGESQLSEASF